MEDIKKIKTKFIHVVNEQENEDGSYSFDIEADEDTLNSLRQSAKREQLSLEQFIEKSFKEFIENIKNNEK